MRLVTHYICIFHENIITWSQMSNPTFEDDNKTSLSHSSHVYRPLQQRSILIYLRISKKVLQSLVSTLAWQGHEFHIHQH